VWTSLPHTRAAPSTSRRPRGWNFRSASQILACAIHPREGHWNPLGAEASSGSTPGMNRASHEGLEAVCVDLTSTYTRCALTLAATPGLEFQKRKPDYQRKTHLKLPDRSTWDHNASTSDLLSFRTLCTPRTSQPPRISPHSTNPENPTPLSPPTHTAPSRLAHPSPLITLANTHHPNTSPAPPTLDSQRTSPAPPTLNSQRQNESCREGQSIRESAWYEHPSVEIGNDEGTVAAAVAAAARDGAESDERVNESPG
jgi:hypothetical protein